MAPSGGRSPGDPVYDPFWARINEAGITVAYHSGEAGYGRYMADWGESAEFEAFRRTPLYGVLTSRPGHLRHHRRAHLPRRVRAASRTCASPPSRAASEWVPALLKKLGKAYSQTPGNVRRRDPVQPFREHVWVAPYYEDDIRGLADAIGADHVLFGSDFPHAEGLAVPTEFVHDLTGSPTDEVRLIMRENAMSLAHPAPEQPAVAQN